MFQIDLNYGLSIATSGTNSNILTLVFTLFFNKRDKSLAESRVSVLPSQNTKLVTGLHTIR